MSMSSRQVLLPDALQAARAALLTPVRAVQTPTGKRVLTAVMLAGVLQVGVSALYQNADAPELPGAAVAAVAPAPADPAAEPAASQPETTQPAPATQTAREAAAPAADKPVRPSPEEAAVAFYALDLGLQEAQVRPLAQQRINDNTVKVLVLAERSPEDLDTRHIQVNRTQSGWRVP